MAYKFPIREVDMPLLEMNRMDQRKEFILLWKSDQFSFSHLCREFHITRRTGYNYVEKYKQGGMEGLENRATIPLHVPNKTPKPIEEAIIKIRTQKETKGWGAKKILWKLEQEGIYEKLPARSTVSLILKRNGLIPERKKRKKVEPQKPIFDPAEPNEVWSADYKGQFRMGNGKYCYPLTICDSKTRHIIEIKGLLKPEYESAKAIFKGVFKVYGLPLQLHTDNGAPFASIRSLGRLTKFSVWLMEHGVQPVYSDPGHPEQNGRHERMHRELKAAVCKNPSKNLQAQQVRFNKFKKFYNEERPHEAIGMVTPSSIYEKSKRLYEEHIEEWEYPSDYKIKNVCNNGIIRVGKSDSIYVTTALKGKKVGLEEIGEGIFRIYFRDFLLGYLDEGTLQVYDIQEYKYVPRV